ncbi:hypothetical protein HAX54_007864 [Datura stramonium]|uniref:Uncharacterized protein n=1 Tax=Datura stramonium TaxID=4076 RepID=A0ABS8TDV9_DATST|nr:hypothetical protein [Datura stramonium]
MHNRQCLAGRTKERSINIRHRKKEIEVGATVAACASSTQPGAANMGPDRWRGEERREGSGALEYGDGGGTLRKWEILW